MGQEVVCSVPPGVDHSGFIYMRTVLLVDEDQLQAHVRKSILGRQFTAIHRAADAAEAFILVEDPAFSRGLALVVVGLNRPGLGSPAFVAELTSRLPSV